MIAQTLERREHLKRLKAQKNSPVSIIIFVNRYSESSGEIAGCRCSITDCATAERRHHQTPAASRDAASPVATAVKNRRGGALTQ